MDTLKKIIHPKDHSSHTNTSTTAAPSEPTTTASFPHQQEQDRLNRQAGFDTTDTSHHPQPRAGHHHPRQPVGATGLPPNHKPRQDFVPTPHQAAQSAQQQPEGGEERLDLDLDVGKQVAEAGNNFPGTNPHPEHSALGNQSMTGERGTLMPGRE